MVTVVPVMAGLVLTPAALAHYYGKANLQGGTFHGGWAYIRSNAMSVPNPSTDFVDNEIWVVDSSFQYWTEAGITIGCVAGGCHGNKPLFYWADSRPNGGGYHEHAGANASLNTVYGDVISYAGNGAWNVAVGSLKGTSTSNITSAQWLQAGTEVTTQSATSCASQSGLGWYDSNGGGHWGWPGASLTANNPPFAYWVEADDWLRNYDNAGC